MKITATLFTLIYLLTFTTSQASARAADLDRCKERRGALDIGSGTTKAVVAWVNICNQQVLETVFEDQLPIPFNEALERSAKNEIPRELTLEAEEKILSLVKKLREYQAQKISAVATSAFRKAKNGSEVAKSLSKKTGIEIKVITQEEEAELGFFAAISKASTAVGDLGKIIVWDIGGGSMQMLTRTQDRTQIFTGDLASVSFKNRIIEKLQAKDPKTTTSPNPLGNFADKAVSLAQAHASENVPKTFKAKATEATWIGIGGVLSISVQNQVNKDKTHFTAQELQKTLYARRELTDEKIGGDYRTTEITNLALVLGYMKALKVDKIETAKVNLAHGLLVRSFSESKSTTKSVLKKSTSSQ